MAESARAAHLFRVAHRVTGEERAARGGHAGAVLWLTGLSGSGKSTIALELERRLFDDGLQVYLLDGDNVRLGINRDLGFSPADRSENIRRVGEVAALMADAGFIAIAAFISPYQADREMARRAVDRHPGTSFHEIYISADLATCIRRDPKGLYRQAQAGEIRDFSGISAPYEPPTHPELVVATDQAAVSESVEQVRGYLRRLLALPPGSALRAPSAKS
ncbi:MAG: adenylyl-sulfate kinase [Chloroflexota bacterium]